MPRNNRTAWAILIGINVLLGCVLSFHQSSWAAPAKEPFANSVEQRGDILTELKEINAQLKEQNALLRSGVKVIVADEPEK